MDFVNRWADKTGIAVACFLLWIGIGTSKWHSWKGRYGRANEHNARVPRRLSAPGVGGITPRGRPPEPAKNARVTSCQFPTLFRAIFR